MAAPVPPAPVARAAGPAGLAYVVLAGAAMLWLRHDPAAGRADVLFLLLIVWAGDIGAYLVGRLIGGPRLAPRFRPARHGPAPSAACSRRLRPGCWRPMSCGCLDLARRGDRRPFWGSLRRPAICWKASSSGAWR